MKLRAARGPLALLLAAAAAAGSGGCGAGPAGAPQRPVDERPNFVVVLADDLGYGDVGVYGQDLIRTPRLDRMAAEGVRFTDFYSAAPICPPAREALLTGLHTGHTRVRWAGPLKADSPARPHYLPRWLAGAGYVSGVFGKWAMGAYRRDETGQTVVVAGAPEWVGFDEFLGVMHHRDAQTQALPPYPQPADERPPINSRLWALRDGASRQLPERPVAFTEDAYLDAALDFVRRHRERPFFLYFALTLPHAELYVPPGDPSWAGYLDAEGESVFPEIPYHGGRRTARPNPRPRATYAAMVTRIDRDVGVLLDLLDVLGIAERTLVVFTSDNGPHRTGGIAGPEFFDSTGGLRGWKVRLEEGGIRVPAIVRWPGTVAAGRVVERPLALYDLAPTLLELAGVERPGGLDGISFAPLLRGDDQPGHDADSPLYWESFAGFRGQAARLGRWKLLRRRLETADDPVALHDLEADPGETEDLSGRPELCPIYLELVRILNRERTDPGGIFSFPPLREECPAGEAPRGSRAARETSAAAIRSGVEAASTPPVLRAGS